MGEITNKSRTLFLFIFLFPYVTLASIRAYVYFGKEKAENDENSYFAFFNKGISSFHWRGNRNLS